MKKFISRRDWDQRNISASSRYIITSFYGKAQGLYRIMLRDLGTMKVLRMHLVKTDEVENLAQAILNGLYFFITELAMTGKIIIVLQNLHAYNVVTRYLSCWKENHWIMRSRPKNLLVLVNLKEKLDTLDNIQFQYRKKERDPDSDPCLQPTDHVQPAID